MAFRILGIILLFFVLSCTKNDDCPECGFYSGLSQKVDFLPGTTTGSYSTTTKTYEVARAGDGFRTDFFFYQPDENGNFYEEVDSSQVGSKGYEALTVHLLNDTLFFILDKTQGRSEEFQGIRIK